MTLRHRSSHLGESVSCPAVRSALHGCREARHREHATDLVLGAIAGLTIFLGLPLGRLRNPAPAVSACLSAPRDRHPALPALGRARRRRRAGRGRADGGDAAARRSLRRARALLAGGFAAGLLSLVAYDRWLKRSDRSRMLVGPGAAAVAEFAARRWIETLTPGQLARAPRRDRDRHPQLRARASRSASRPPRGEIALALALIIGFGLHNATEGFGIVGAAVRRARSADAGASSALLGADRRRADVPRHGDRPGVDERGAVGRLLRARGGLDPLRRQSSSSASTGSSAARSLVAWVLLLGLSSASPRTSCSTPSAPSLPPQR